MRAVQQARVFRDSGTGYFKEMSTKPQTMGYGLLDSPVALATFIYENFQVWSDNKGDPEDALSTTAMLDSGRLVRETQRQARRGDLAFYGSGHVEFFVRSGHTFGALNSGTLVGWHTTNAWWHPTMFFRVRGAG